MSHVRSLVHVIACALLACGVFCVLGSPARAQRAIDVQIWKAPAGQSAALTIPEPELPAHGTLVLGATASYARSVLVRKVACDASATVLDSSCVSGDRDGRTPVATDLVQIEASLAASLYDALQLGLIVPVAFARVADDLAAPQHLSSRAALSDLRLSVLAPIVSGDSALGFALTLSLPTGRARDLLGDRNWTATPALVFRQRIGASALSLAAGYRFRAETHVAGLGLELDDELDFALGARVPIVRSVELRAEVMARVGVAADRMRANQNPVETDLGVAFQLAPATSLVVGGGTGFWPNRDAYGAPSVRVLASLRYAFEPVPCRFGPEDYDGFEDGDSCRDPDNDGDGIEDDADACPNDAEDRDGFEDGDGCPDFDDDADGLTDQKDRCPFQSEDRDGFEDDDGCPEPDNDADGVADGVDACAMDPEDRDGFEDDDGCPEPGPERAAITLTEGRILVSERIYFEYDRDTIRSVSTPLLDQLARVIAGLAPGVKVMVEGHTDDGGNPAYNLDLSHRRARAVVEYLHARGVPSERLDFIGYGASKPVAPNDSPDERALNRRVEFMLVR